MLLNPRHLNTTSVPFGEATVNRPGQSTTTTTVGGPTVVRPTATNTPVSQPSNQLPQPTGGPLDPSQSTLSANFAPYVYDMLSMGQGLANLPFQPYTGDRFAGPSGLQQQAFTGIGGLQTPGAIGQGVGLIRQAGQEARGTEYRPGQFGADIGQTGFGGLAYTPGQISTGLGALGSVADYMSPYTRNVTDILEREATRQAEIQRQSDQARLSQAGAYGGSRQAILDAERARNLATQVGDIREKGLASAWEQAQRQRLAESQLGTEAQRLSEASRQFGATYGLDVEKATEAARQFRGTQGLEAQRLGEQSRQFGADFGLRGLAQQIAAGTALGQLGSEEAAQERANLGMQLSTGETQRKLTQDPLDFAYQQWQESMKWPYQQATFMSSLLQGLPLQAGRYDSGQSSSNALIQGIISALGLEQYLNQPPQ